MAKKRKKRKERKPRIVGTVVAAVEAGEDEAFDAIVGAIEDALDEFADVGLVIAEVLVDDEDEDDEDDTDDEDTDDEDTEDEDTEEDDTEDSEDEDDDVLTEDDLRRMRVGELKALAKEYDIRLKAGAKKADIIDAIIETAGEEED